MAWAKRVVLLGFFVSIATFILTWPDISVGDRTKAEVVVAIAPNPQLDRALSGPLLQLMVAKYSTFAAADSTLAAVAKDQGLSLDDVRSSTEVTIAAGTGNITISHTRDSPELAVRVTSELAKRTVERATGDLLIRATSISARTRHTSSSVGPSAVISSVALSLAAGIASAALTMRVASIVYRAGLPA